jgi:hypothetical protein
MVISQLANCERLAEGSTNMYLSVTNQLQKSGFAEYLR